MLPILNVCGCGSVQTDSPAWTDERSLTVNPATLTLPTDPLLTLVGSDGQPVWLDLPEQVRAVSSNPLVATVNQRVRVRTTDLAGSSEISLALLEDPAVRALFRLTTVDAAVNQVKLDGPDHFELFVGQSIPIEATAVLTSGHVIPHAQYSSDLDLLQGAQYAAVVDGLGVTALQPSPSRTPITIGFARAGGQANGTLSVRPRQLVDVQLSLGGLPEASQGFLIPSGFQARLEALGTFEDGSRRRLQLGSDFSVRLTGDAGFLCTPPGFLSQPLPQRTTSLQLQFHDRLLETNVTTVDGSAPLRLSADFANYPEDRHLLLGARSYARELRVLADFTGLVQYRVSSLDGLTSSRASLYRLTWKYAWFANRNPISPGSPAPPGGSDIPEIPASPGCSARRESRPECPAG